MTTESKLTKREETLPEETRADRQVAPPVDIYENQDEILLVADMPGVTKDDLQVRIDKDVLVVEGKKSFELPKGLLNCEIEPCTYTRSFSLPQTIDGDRISAKLELGVLTVHLPKRDSVKPRQIQVTAG
jgi:HSP20 family molecular chaperone IbpA